MLYEKEPTGFRPKFEVASCFCEFDGKILLLQRREDKPQGGTWALPGGKLDGKETPTEAVIRETGEETGIILSEPVGFFKKFFVRFSDMDFIYNLFYSKLKNEPKLTLSDREHSNYLWVRPIAAVNMNLMQDLDSCIRVFYGIEK